MPYDRPDYSYYGRGEYGPAYEEPRTPYGTVYTRPSHGYETGYGTGELRSRGYYGAAPMVTRRIARRGPGEFRWGDGYIGGRGYGGTNYDYEHGYQTGGRTWSRRPERGAPPAGAVRRSAGYGWGRAEHAGSQVGGPARYGYGPYHERLRRRRRSDDEIEDDVGEALFYDTWVDADRIRIGVEEGVVTLEGTLPDYDEVRYATDDAWDVDGVRGVRTELDVDETPASDRLGRQRQFTAGQLAEANEAGRAGGAPRDMGEHLAPPLGRKTVGPRTGERLKPRPGASAGRRPGASPGPQTGETAGPRTDAAAERETGGGAGHRRGETSTGAQTPGTERSAGQWSGRSEEAQRRSPSSERSGESEEQEQ